MKPKTLWIDDDYEQRDLWEGPLREYFDIVEIVEDAVTALRSAEDSGKRLDVIVSDLRIRSGPSGPYPPTHTPFVYGLKLFKDMEDRGLNRIPVVAYSRFLAPGSPTLTAVTSKIAQIGIVLGYYATQLSVERVVKKMHFLTLEFLKFKLAAPKSVKVQDFTALHPPSIHH